MKEHPLVKASLNTAKGVYEATADVYNTYACLKAVMANPFSDCLRTELADQLKKDWEDAKKVIGPKYSGNIEKYAKDAGDTATDYLDSAKAAFEAWSDPSKAAEEKIKAEATKAGTKLLKDVGLTNVDAKPGSKPPADQPKTAPAPVANDAAKKPSNPPAGAPKAK